MKRFTDTEIWDKEWFMSLSPKLKLLIKFIHSKCDAAGVWAPNFTLATAYIGEHVSYADLSMFGNQLEILPDGKIFVSEFIVFQYGVLTEKCMPHRKVIQLLKKHGLYERVSNISERVSEKVERVSDRVSDTLEDKEEDKDNNTGNTVTDNTCVITQGGENHFSDEPPLFHPAQIPAIAPFQHVNDLAKSYLTESAYSAAREQLCMSLFLKPDDLESLLMSFNGAQIAQTKHMRQLPEYISHFRNWAQKQPKKQGLQKSAKTADQIIAERNKSIR